MHRPCRRRRWRAIVRQLLDQLLQQNGPQETGQSISALTNDGGVNTTIIDDS